MADLICKAVAFSQAAAAVLKKERSLRVAAEQKAAQLDVKLYHTTTALQASEVRTDYAYVLV